MSNRDALRKLSRRVPSRPEIENIMKGLEKEPDLSAVITGGAIVEAALESLLKSKFRYRDSNLIGQLFLNRGPLMDFHSKIIVAQAFGVLTSPLAQELHSIKSIRNAFAHSKVPLGFEHEPIAREMRSSRMRSVISRGEQNGHLTDMDDRSWFMLVVKVVLVIMQSIEDSPHLADGALADALDTAEPLSPDELR